MFVEIIGLVIYSKFYWMWFVLIEFFKKYVDLVIILLESIYYNVYGILDGVYVEVILVYI